MTWQRIIQCHVACAALLLVVSSLQTVCCLSSPPFFASTSTAPTLVCGGNWEAAKVAVRDPKCCVVSVTGMEPHLQTLQHYVVDHGPSDLDLRRRIRVTHLWEDCRGLQQSILGVVSSNDCDSSSAQEVTQALVEIAGGAARMADGPLSNTDVFLRVVCATDYKARDPMFHTDKCFVRGYVTLRGIGTEYRTTVCNPLEYAALRGFGASSSSGEAATKSSLRQAQELEFIVMKGDHYKATPNIAPALWTRASACVHRSPPGKGGRRVILSFDLASGEDDREWYETIKKREWRSGMTQRKSRLVA